MFYAAIAEGRVPPESGSDDWVQIQMADGVDIAFQRVAEYEPPQWPDGRPQQAHLDFDVADLDAAEEAVMSLGARKSTTQPAPDKWRVFLDPAGHPFCLVQV